MIFETNVFLTVGVGIIVCVLTYLLLKYISNASKGSCIDVNGTSLAEDETEKSKTSSKRNKATSKVSSTSSVAVAQFSHNWFLTNLKGHSGSVLDLDFSPNGKHLVSCADDRTLLFFNVSSFEDKEHKAVRGNVDLDHAKLLQFGPDSRSVVVCLTNANRVGVYKFVKKDDTSGFKIQSVDVDFASNHIADIISIGISCNGKFIMSADSKTTITIWDLKGNILKTIDTKQGNNNFAAVSSCGRFFGSSGFTSDVKLWEVAFTKAGDFQDVVRAFELKGHTSGVYSFAFNNNSSRMLTASKDGTFRIWNTDIEYRLGQEPYLLHTVQLDGLKTSPANVALSPRGDVALVAINRRLSIYNLASMQEETVIENLFNGGIVRVLFSVCGRYFAAGGDKFVRVFHNVAGHRALISETEALFVKAQGQAHKDRLKLQLHEAREALVKILEGKKDS